MFIPGDSTIAIDQRRAELWFTAWLGSGALWQLIECEPPTAARASFDQNQFQLPRHNLAHHRASVAHFYAHRRFGAARFEVKNLRPIQIVLISLFEDARVEQLSLRERPGLRRLWAPYIDALRADTHRKETSLSKERTSQVDDVVGLLRRLTIALFDPAWPVAHPWVNKARRLFYSRQTEWHDSALSRGLGNLLGNDIGQMRLQFNWKSYVVEPVYRDDHRGLWYDNNDPTPQQEKQAGIRLDDTAVRIAAAPVAGDTTARSGEIGDWLSAGATPVIAAQTLPEWDYARRFYRAAWVSVRERAAVPGDTQHLSKIAAAGAGQQWQRQAINHRRHQPHYDGDALDIDACIRTIADRRLGHSTDMRIYRRAIQQQPPRALVILIDSSLSMNVTLSSGVSTGFSLGFSLGNTAGLSILDYAKAVALRCAERAMRGGDRVAIYGFCSDGRHALHITTVKKFSDTVSNNEISARLAGINAAYSTRLGGALRYAKNLFSGETETGEIMVFSDGEVSDIDAADPKYLYEDARQAARELKDVGIELNLINCLNMTEVKPIIR